MTTDMGSPALRLAEIRRSGRGRRPDAGAAPEMLADAPLAFLETLATRLPDRTTSSPPGSRRSWPVPVTRSSSRPGGRLVGHAGGTTHPNEPGLTVIYAVYVTPTWRGSGLLGELIDGVAAWSRACGRPELLLEVVVGNDRAYRAYQRLGFKDTGVQVPHPNIPALNELQMRRTA